MDSYEESHIITERISKQYDFYNLTKTDRFSLANELRDLYRDEVLNVNQICDLVSKLGEEMFEDDAEEISEILRDFKDKNLDYIALSLVVGNHSDEIQGEDEQLRREEGFSKDEMEDYEIEPSEKNRWFSDIIRGVNRYNRKNEKKKARLDKIAESAVWVYMGKKSVTERTKLIERN